MRRTATTGVGEGGTGAARRREDRRASLDGRPARVRGMQSVGSGMALYVGRLSFVHVPCKARGSLVYRNLRRSPATVEQRFYYLCLYTWNDAAVYLPNALFWRKAEMAVRDSRRARPPTQLANPCARGAQETRASCRHLISVRISAVQRHSAADVLVIGICGVFFCVSHWLAHTEASVRGGPQGSSHARKHTHSNVSRQQQERRPPEQQPPETLRPLHGGRWGRAAPQAVQQRGLRGARSTSPIVLPPFRLSGASRWRVGGGAEEAGGTRRADPVHGRRRSEGPDRGIA